MPICPGTEKRIHTSGFLGLMQPCRLPLSANSTNHTSSRYPWNVLPVPPSPTWAQPLHQDQKFHWQDPIGLSSQCGPRLGGAPGEVWRFGVAELGHLSGAGDSSTVEHWHTGQSSHGTSTLRGIHRNYVITAGQN